MIRVMVVDDHAVVRRGVIEIMEESPSIRCTGEAASVAGALKLLNESQFDLVVLDLHLEDGSGLDVLKQIRSYHPNLLVLILSMYPEKQYALQTFQLGAAGYVTKNKAPDELVLAIEKVAGGGKYISSEAQELLLENLLHDQPGAPHKTLSTRELQLLEMLGQGYTVSQVADSWSLSVKTVSTYRVRVLKKLGVTTTADLIRYAIEHGLTE